MDGNRRWAKKQNLPKLEGHRRGFEKLKEVSGWCKEAGVKYLTVYAFSTENWQRSEDEVGYLLELIRRTTEQQTAEAVKDNIRLLFPGDLSRFPKDIQETLRKSEEATRANDAYTLAIALSYGGRTEIIDAIHRIPKEKLEHISEQEFAALLWTSSIPDPEMIIRTSGEERLSGFLTWACVYSELFFTPTLWPDFSKEELLSIIEEYHVRERRLGR